MYTNIDLINKFPVQTNSILNKSELRSIMGQQIATLLSLTNRISSAYDKYLEAINLRKRNILSPLIVTSKNLVEELSNYRSKYELVVPPNLRNLSVIYKTMNIQLIFTGSLIMFALNSPLITKTTFDLHNLISLPIQKIPKIPKCATHTHTHTHTGTRPHMYKLLSLM